MSTFLCFFEAGLKPIAASATLIKKSPPPWNTFLVYTRAHVLGDSIKGYRRDFCRWNRLMWLRECWSSQSGGARIHLHRSGAPDFSNSSKTRAKPTIYETISWLGWVRPDVVYPLEACTPPAKERIGVEPRKGNLRSRFWPNPSFNIVWCYSSVPHFMFCGQCRTGEVGVY